MDKAEQLEALAYEINLCKKCPLCYKRTKPTIARGDPRSPLMIVSDYPRAKDHEDEEILKGRAGKKIDELLTKAGIKPEQVYFTSLMKCFPGNMGYFPEDDSPAKCFPYLMQQIKIVKPLVVVLAGPEALLWALARGTGEKTDSTSDWSGKMFRRREIYDELRFAVIPHPTKLCKGGFEKLEEECIATLSMVKKFIVSRQKDELAPDIVTIDLKKQIIHDKKDQLEAFKWKKPEPPPEPGKSNQPTTSP